ncbi:hypothetical protein N658DRAFT_501421 [Parathielavia hyrcaniae]|uniref:Uncharacterized protein n=1 Tax=Parathielavia hyrcaniae TaxID=113614 RepID=A0AAN6SWM8_9PEZI|nr:hypothetical protein N658DRAFT_501421 [Parathielavia hyrcaniae]
MRSDSDLKALLQSDYEKGSSGWWVKGGGGGGAASARRGRAARLVYSLSFRRLAGEVWALGSKASLPLFADWLARVLGVSVLFVLPIPSIPGFEVRRAEDGSIMIWSGRLLEDWRQLAPPYT